MATAAESQKIEELLQSAEGLLESWKRAEQPFSDSDFDGDDALAELHAVGHLAVHEAQLLAKALRSIREKPPVDCTAVSAGEPGSVTEIYSRSPLAPLILEAIDHRPGESTSEDFQRGYLSALMVSHLRGAAALESHKAAQ